MARPPATKNNKKNFDRSVDLTTIEYGKIPPQARDLEEAILGAIMLEKDSIDKVLERLTPECFYIEAHQRIMKSMIDLVNKSQPIDIHTVVEQLRVNEDLEQCGGPYYVTKLTNSVVSSANIEAHARIVFQKHLQRQLIKLGGQMIHGGFEDLGDVFDLIDHIEGNLFEITKTMHSNNYAGMSLLLVNAVQRLEKMKAENKDVSGVASGFPSIDRITFGWQKTDLIILAARPGVGKTAFALNLARNAAKAGTPVAFFSLEMSAGQLINRLMSSESEIALEKIQRGRLDEDESKRLYVKGIQPLSDLPIFIDDTAGLNVFELRAKARRLKQKEKVGLIIVDYLQLMSGTSTGHQRNREQEISEISRNLKKLAKELDIPIIALSQLSRETEKRGGDKTPILSDLRESGAIEQDADAVIFIYRAEYHGIHRDAGGESTSGETVIKFAKYRNGSPGSVKLRAQLWIQKFIEMENVPFESIKTNDKDGRKNGLTTLWQPFKEKDDQIDSEDQTFK